MLSKHEHALALAAEGFYVFPVLPWPQGEPGSEGKTPAIGAWQKRATRDPEIINRWWKRDPDRNIGISTGAFGDARDEGHGGGFDALLVVDVDTKSGKQGLLSLAEFELEEGTLPATRTHTTATGGRHLIFRVPQPVSSRANVLGPGLDIRSGGGYIVAPGSTIGGREYRADRPAQLALAPERLVARCVPVRNRVDRQRAAPATLPDEAAVDLRGREYLSRASLAIEGQGGDQQTYVVACWLRDIGATEAKAFELMRDHWNDRCVPPWDHDELELKVKNAFAYSQNIIGAKAPEAAFTPLAVRTDDPTASGGEGVHPLARFNREFAHVIAGGGVHILWETEDAKGRRALEHLSLQAFHSKHAAERMALGERRERPMTEHWIEWTGRRSYDGIVFDPSGAADDRFYNLWRGFAVEPWPDDQPIPADYTEAVQMFKEHLHKNICRSDTALAHWLWGFFAHLVQKPHEKPLVAIVMKGQKGVGKNALLDVIGGLLGSSFKLASNRRYLVSHFNGHLENLLMFVLDEAFWSGDKQAEATLKDLVTGAAHQIEHKGKEQYEVDNLTRVCIIGNEDWLVPATHDERRYAVFNVGNGRQKQGAWFAKMKRTMREGANRVLLKELLAFDLTTVNVNQAPMTEGLLEQKHASLEPFHAFWLDCLMEGMLVHGDIGHDWPAGVVETERVRYAFRKWARERNVRSRLPSDIDIGKSLHMAMPELTKLKKVVRGARTTVYEFPSLDAARQSWETFIGQPVMWKEWTK